jgi:hypothetical protein
MNTVDVIELPNPTMIQLPHGECIGRVNVRRQICLVAKVVGEAPCRVCHVVDVARSFRAIFLAMLTYFTHPC